jgi:alkylation response protein AidB-like acyl-CoA dehydrogenase
LFGLGVDGHRNPRAHGGSGATFFHSVLAVEALSRVDPAVGVLVDVHNTLVINALTRWSSEEIQQRYFPRLASRAVGRVCAIGGRLGHAMRSRWRPGPSSATTGWH